MKKLIANFYFTVILSLCAQAIFVIIAGNNTTINRLKYEKITSENDALEEEIIILHDRIASKQALANLLPEASSEGFIAIENTTNVHYHQVNDKILASLGE